MHTSYPYDALRSGCRAGARGRRGDARAAACTSATWLTIPTAEGERATSAPLPQELQPVSPSATMPLTHAPDDACSGAPPLPFLPQPQPPPSGTPVRVLSDADVALAVPWPAAIDASAVALCARAEVPPRHRVRALLLRRFSQILPLRSSLFPIHPPCSCAPDRAPHRSEIERASDPSALCPSNRHVITGALLFFLAAVAVSDPGA